MATKKSGSRQASGSRKKKVEAKSSSTRGGTSSRRTTRKKKTNRRSSSSSTRRKSQSQRRGTQITTQQKAIWGGVFLVFVTGLIMLSLLSPNQGAFTQALSGAMRQLFGWGSVIIPLFVGGIGLFFIFWGMGQPPSLSQSRLAGGAILFLTLEAFATILSIGSDNGLNSVSQALSAATGGGLVGGALTFLAAQAGGLLGAIVIWLLIGLAGIILLAGITQTDLQTAWAAIQTMWERREFSRQIAARRQAGSRTTPVQQPLDLGLDETPQETVPIQRMAEEEDTSQPAAPTRPRRRTRRTLAGAESDVAFVGSGSEKWKLPAISNMLESGGAQQDNDRLIQEQAEIIEQTLHSFGAPVKIAEISYGPTVTQFGVIPEFIQMRNGKRTKVKVGKIASLADDLALALAARSIRIQAPVPGKGYVGIEVPNSAKALVSLRDVMESDEFSKIRPPLRIGLGQNVAGQSIAASLIQMPHLLIAGATGAGKSVCVNGIIAGFLLQYTPEELRFVMVDPKRVELTGYNGIPHLVAPVVVDIDRVVGTLQWAMREMDNRYKKLAEMGARNVIEYNKKVGRRKNAARLPYIVIIIDELADLMMMSPEDTERGITRLAQMARATGIHMIIATQRPSVDVVTGLIKANFPARIAFAVSSSTDSRVILDTTGAERLLGQGDMLFQSPDAAAPLRLQGCYVSPEELDRIIGYWRSARLQSHSQTPEAEIPRVEPQRPPGRSASSIPEPAAEAAPAPAPSPETRETAAAEPVPEPIVNESLPAEKPKRKTKAKAKAKPKPKRQPKRAAKKAAENGAGKEESPASSQPILNETQPALWEDLIEPEAKPEEDELMGEAVALVRKLNKASTSLLQRRFRIGYTRAARLIDEMEERGIIGPATGTSKAREVMPATEGEGGSSGENAGNDKIVD